MDSVDQVITEIKKYEGTAEIIITTSKKSEKLEEQCDHIICAARSRGETVDNTIKAAGDGNYVQIDTRNYCTEEMAMRGDLNGLFALHVLELLSL